MRFSYAVACLLPLVSAASEPCGQITQVLATKGQATLLDPDLVLQCLRSVPIQKSGDTLQLEGISVYANFQSTLAYLKNPPPGYLYPAVDVLDSLAKMKDDLQSGKYTNEYDFQLALYNLINVQTHDQHFQYTPDILQVFNFQRAGALYSVSKDGVEVPQVYHADDIPILAVGGRYTPSPITSINGDDVETFLNDIASTYLRGQDPDANYNAVFPIVPLENFGQAGEGLDNYFLSFQAPPTSPGKVTTVKFKNGTTLDMATWATTSYDFTGVTDGATFFRKLCTGDEIVVSSSAVASASASVVPSASPGRVVRSKRSKEYAVYPRQAGASDVPPGSAVASASATPAIRHSPYAAVPSATAVPETPSFPGPWIFASDLSVLCYFPESKQNLAVISVPTFEPASAVEFGNVIRQCLATASNLHKTKLIIDLRGNGGGIVPDGYDMFKELFPSTTPWGTGNHRAWSLFDKIGTLTSARFENVTAVELGNQAFAGPFGSIFNVNNLLTVANTAFKSWQDFYGPVHTHGDIFTELTRFNLSSKFDMLDSGLTGYKNLTHLVPRATFAPADILLLHDGQCASTCTVFAEFMKTQKAIGSVAMGGRAQTGPMQGVGGVKGASVLPISYILDQAKAAFKNASASQQAALQQQYGSEFDAIEHAITRGDPSNVEINIRNNIRKGDPTLTPLQFVYEAADCRLFYTAEMLLDQELVWGAAYDSYWNGAACVAGSTGQESSKPGTSYILSPPPTKDTLTTSAKSPQNHESKNSNGASAMLEGGRSIAMVVGLAAVATMFIW